MVANNEYPEREPRLVGTIIIEMLHDGSALAVGYRRYLINNI